MRILFTCLAFVSATALAQTYEPPRTTSGKPDLQGFWTNASITTMQRSETYNEIGLVIPQDQVATLTANNHNNVRAATDDNQVAGELPDGTDLARGRGYNAFWVDPGSRFGVVNGETRTSWITHPQNGRIPYSEEGTRLRREAFARRGNDGPEGRALGERCIIGFGSTGGPPMNNVLYNNMYQIVQTDDYLMIMIEMVHDTRIIPINGNHRPEALEQWLGDSVGYWDGDTLVVETINLHPQQAPQNIAPLSDQGKVIERFSRYSDTEILYEFEVSDPVYYSEDWRGQMVFNQSSEQPYEYACHEGNYGMIGILAGARRLELDPSSD